MNLLTRITSEAHLHHSHQHLLACLAQEARRRTLPPRPLAEWQPPVVYSEAHSKRRELVCLDLRRRRRIQRQPSLVRPEDCSAVAASRLSKRLPAVVLVVVCLGILQLVNNNLNSQLAEDYLAAMLPHRNNSSNRNCNSNSNSRQAVVFSVRQQSTPRLVVPVAASSGSHKQSHQEVYCKLQPSLLLEEVSCLLVPFSLFSVAKRRASNPKQQTRCPQYKSIMTIFALAQGLTILPNPYKMKLLS